MPVVMPVAKVLLLLGVTGLLAACGSTAPVRQSGNPESSTARDVNQATQRQFENAIAARLLSQVGETLPTLSGQQRADYLTRRLRNFQQSVDVSVLTSRLRLEHDLFVYLEKTARQAGDNTFDRRIRQLTTLDRSLVQHEQALTRELTRLDQTIAVLAATDPADFDLARHMASIRGSANVPDNSPSGRQRYLDRVSEALFESQLNWPDVLQSYKAAELSILGTTGAPTSFTYDAGILRIDLTDVRDLPGFELRPAAAYFGYPGQHALALSSRRENRSLKSLLTLPAYHLGWAAYVTDYLGTRDVEHTLDYLYFLKTRAALAMVDLRLNRGDWQRDAAHHYLVKETPYAEHRLELMINEVQAMPGYHLSGMIGKLEFSALHHYCQVTQGQCGSDFHQRIVDLGPIPFSLLKDRI